jgi:hypothetical protein
MPAIYQNFSKGLVQTSLGNINPRDTSATEQYVLGTELIKKDQKWRYCKNGAGALAAGKTVAAPADVANHNTAALAATDAGSKTVAITLGNTAATANQYAGGFLQIEDDAGEGYLYRVASHPAHDGGGSLTVTLEEGLVIAVTADTTAGLVANPWSSVIVGPTAEVSHIVGVSTSVVPVNEYFWAQVSGPCSVLADTALTKGHGVVRGTGVAGAVETSAADTDTLQPIGVCIQSAADTEYGAINLTIE